MSTNKVNNTIVTPIDERETFVSVAKSISDSDGITMEEKLRTLYNIQVTDTEIDDILLQRGELPLEVQDLEDDIEGLKTRCFNIQSDIKELESSIADYRNMIEESKQAIVRYKAQQENIRNNREYESISKEIEYQTLEQEACEKKIREAQAKIADFKNAYEQTKSNLAGRELDLVDKKQELATIIEETAKDEEILLARKAELSKKIDPRVMVAYNKVRSNAKNHLAVVTVERGACGGCFNKIPPQRKLDIEQSKKIIVCEYCGRILVDPELAGVHIDKNAVEEKPRRRRVAKRREE